MATQTFGRRGAPPRIAAPSFQPARVAAAPAAPAAVIEATAEPGTFDLLRDNKLIADIPFLTFAMIAFLLAIFWLEKHFAFDIDRDGDLSVRSLIAFGASSRDLVVGSGQWWRIAMAPLLHASTSHVVGNSVALAFVGLRLEPTIGRGWFLLIFVVSGIGGEVGSLIGNPPGIPSVGASGAITGLIGALFVMSFNPYADLDQQRRMRKTALRFGVPALAPLAWGASGGVDYFGHAGGAVAGAATGMVICLMWSAENIRPNHARLAGILALVGFAVSLFGSVIVATRYAGHAAQAAQFIRLAEIPKDMRAGAQRSADLVARYPKDPIAHLLRAVYFAEAQRLHEAEAELRVVIALASADIAGGAIRSRAQAILAAVLMEQGRRTEAKALAAETCGAGESDPMRKILAKAKLCD
jgi:membrane associated rhomboid family serine protease